MDRPNLISMETAAMLPPGANNPRNSEGDFARLRNGKILFAYSRYTGKIGDDDAPCDIAGLLSADDGRTFAPLPEPLVRASQHETENVMSVSLCRLQNGTLCLFYLCKYGAQSAYVLRR